MTPKERELLTQILIEVQRIEQLPRYWTDYSHGHGDNSWSDSLIQREQLPEIGVRVLGHWLGGDSAGRQARRRGLLALEAAGHVTLAAAGYDGVKTTHVKLTDQGRILAESFDVEHVTNPGDAQ